MGIKLPLPRLRAAGAAAPSALVAAPALTSRSRLAAHRLGQLSIGHEADGEGEAARLDLKLLRVVHPLDSVGLDGIDKRGQLRQPDAFGHPAHSVRHVSGAACNA